MATPTDEKRWPAAKTPRTCDSCTRLRARWFCAADDAFLCHVCDAAVHAANPLASRHRRLHVGTNMPAWHRGFNRKPRTPRAHHKLPPPLPAQSPVPELDTSADEGDDSQLLYRVVPVLDVHGEVPAQVDHDAKVKGEGSTWGVDFVGFLPTEMELAEFSADMDSLLGVDSLCMEGVDSKVEVGDEEGEGLGFRFDFESPALTGEEEMMVVEAEQEVKRVALKLDYEAVMAEWEVMIGASPWSDCRRPDCMGIWNGGGGGAMGMGGDGGREARVSRYREKRRMRLFSKKIRYEVRKLNAEKRPRMKGRFVKRASSFTKMAAGTVC